MFCPNTKRAPVRQKRSAVLLAVAAAGLATAPRALAEKTLYRNAERATELVLNLDAIGALYQSDNAWFGESEAFLGAPVDRWAELGVEPTLSFETRAGRGSLFAALSGVYTSTVGDDAAGSTVGLADTGALTLEQAHVGWRREDVFSALDGDTLSITAGRLDYSIGTGLLVDDGSADGGDRGGWYLGMRKSFAQALVASLDSETWLFEVFQLSNQPRTGETRGEAHGANVEYRFGDSASLGTSYLWVDMDDPLVETLDVYSARASWRGGGLTLAAEYVDESSGQIDATGHYAQIGYVLDSRPWSPELRLRRAIFGGDDPATPLDERFREIAYGMTEWGSWYQGEITGEYALGNGNLESQLARLTLAPSEAVTFDVLYYRFALEQPASFGATADDWGDELDFAVEWAASESVSVTGVLGVLRPGDAAEEIVGGSSDWAHAMVLVSYSW